MITLNWKNEVLNTLKGKPDGDIINLSLSHGNYDRFVEAVKLIIDWGYDNDNGFCLTFNDTFTMLKKRNHRVPQTPPPHLSEN